MIHLNNVSIWWTFRSALWLMAVTHLIARPTDDDDDDDDDETSWLTDWQTPEQPNLIDRSGTRTTFSYDLLACLHHSL